jgi:hypothetical protein
MIGGLIARHPLTVIRAEATEDRRGDVQRDWATATRTTSDGWAVDAGDTTDLDDGRTGSDVAWTVRGSYAADVVSSDRVELFGQEYDIDGEVLRQPGPSALTSHTIVRLIRIEG